MRGMRRPPSNHILEVAHHAAVQKTNAIKQMKWRGRSREQVRNTAWQFSCYSSTMLQTLLRNTCCTYICNLWGGPNWAAPLLLSPAPNDRVAWRYTAKKETYTEWAPRPSGKGKKGLNSAAVFVVRPIHSRRGPAEGGSARPVTPEARPVTSEAHTVTSEAAPPKAPAR
jgi:hypothetical protein